MGKKAKNKPTNASSSKAPVSSSPIGYIIPNALYLAPVSATGNLDLLKREGITDVISIGKNPVTRVDGIAYNKFGLLDDEDANLIPVVDKVCEVLDGILPPLVRHSGGGQETRQEGEEDAQDAAASQEASKEEDRDPAMDMSEQSKTTGQGRSQARVLIHCSAAISRSPAVVAGYLMKSRGMSLRESLKVLVNAREVVSPNVGFLRQLCQLERRVFGLDEGDTGAFDIESLKGGGKLGKALGA